MQLSPDHGTIESAIAELDRAGLAAELFRHRIGTTALRNIIAERKRRHRKRSALRRVLRQWRARELVLEAAVD
jgi:hypothetical protein